MVLIIHSCLFIFISCFFIGLSKCDLEAILTNSRFPAPAYYIRSIYDGGDSIYIFGGRTKSYEINRIHRYQISSDTLSLPIALFHGGRYGGGISSDSSGNIFYFGGYIQSVNKFEPINANLSEVAQLEADFNICSAVTNPDSPDIAYIIGGGLDSNVTATVQCFNMSSASFCGRIEISLSSNQNSAFVHGKKAFVFARDATDILVLDLKSLQSEIIAPALPTFIVEPSVVTDGRYAYLIGGWYNSSRTPTDSLIRFDPETLQFEFVHVRNHPGGAIICRFDSSSTVYVEKLNRIYMFGGSTWTGADQPYHDEIWYIDLPTYVAPTTPPTTTIAATTTASTETTPTDSITWIPTTTALNPDIFSCEGKPNGMYPHPSDCASYIGCYEGELSLYECPPPLLFHPERERCDFPEEVDCLISCLGRPDGFYPHPHHCHLFIGCLGGSLRVHKCPDELLFHPVLLMCWYPEEVECLTE